MRTFVIKYDRLGGPKEVKISTAKRKDAIKIAKKGLGLKILSVEEIPYESGFDKILRENNIIGPTNL